MANWINEKEWEWSLIVRQSLISFVCEKWSITSLLLYYPLSIEIIKKSQSQWNKKNITVDTKQSSADDQEIKSSSMTVEIAYQS